jgi:hypothetical protein
MRNTDAMRNTPLEKDSKQNGGNFLKPPFFGT